VSLWDRSFLRFTLIEWVVALVVLLFVARFIWAEEVVSFEDSLFESMGIGGGAKYFITVPTAVFLLYHLYRREKEKSGQGGQKLVRPQVLIISITAVVLAITFVVFLAKN